MYQLAIIERPADWAPARSDDLPEALGEPLTLGERFDDVFAAAVQSTLYNEASARQTDRTWAIVVDPTARSRRWPGPRICTPLQYGVATVLRPDGWEPSSPLDIPNCILQLDCDAVGADLSYRQVIDTMRALNQQSLDTTAANWYIPVGIEHEPLSESTVWEPPGVETTKQVRRVHVICPDQAGHGDCSCCPAHSLPCVETTRPPVMLAEVTRRRTAAG